MLLFHYRGVQCQNSGLGAYVTHNATQPLSDITGGESSDYMQLHLKLQKDFKLLIFPSHGVAKPAIVLLKIKIGGVPL